MSTAAIADHDQLPLPASSEGKPALPFRSDTILGVCEAIGQDLGFNPNWLRVPFAALILWNPQVIIACYLLLGIVVAAARWFFPVGPKVAEREGAEPAATNASPVTVDKAESEELLAA